MHNYLKKILEEKHHYVTNVKANVSLMGELDDIAAGARKHEYQAKFIDSLRQPGLRVIAEVKRKSPSKGHLAEINDPIALAKVYESAGAAAISVLTDEYGFNGSISDLSAVSQAVECPLLRKDFIIDEVQIAEAIYYGASAVLLIVAVLDDKTGSFIAACERMGIDALVEVHNADELNIAIDADASIIGVNNRNLETFEVDINNSLELYDSIPKGVVSIAESGIKDIATAQKYQKAGFDAILVGEALVTASSPASFIREVVDG
jgi:indole-3-glycerol phosphate synthase